MKFDEFTTIYRKELETLKLWRDKNKIPYDEQTDSRRFIGNLSEEVAEITRSTNLDDKVGEISDIMVFCLNIVRDGNIVNMIDITNLVEDDRDPDYSEIYYVYQILRLMGSTLNIRVKSFAIAYVCSRYIEFLGYDHKGVLDETIKKVLSRPGHWNREKGKFIKNPGGYLLEDAEHVLQRDLKITEFKLRIEEDTHWHFEEIKNPGSIISIAKWYSPNYSQHKKKEQPATLSTYEYGPRYSFQDEGDGFAMHSYAMRYFYDHRSLSSQEGYVVRLHINNDFMKDDYVEHINSHDKEVIIANIKKLSEKALKEITNRRDSYGQKLLFGGTSKYREFEREGYESLSKLVDDVSASFERLILSVSPTDEEE